MHDLFLTQSCQICISRAFAYSVPSLLNSLRVQFKHYFLGDLEKIQIYLKQASVTDVWFSS